MKATTNETEITKFLEDHGIRACDNREAYEFAMVGAATMIWDMTEDQMEEVRIAASKAQEDRDVVWALYPDKTAPTNPLILIDAHGVIIVDNQFDCSISVYINGNERGREIMVKRGFNKLRYQYDRAKQARRRARDNGNIERSSEMREKVEHFSDAMDALEEEVLDAQNPIAHRLYTKNPHNLPFEPTRPTYLRGWRGNPHTPFSVR